MPRKDQGVTQDRYQIIPRTLIFIRDADKVLLLKGAPHKRLWPNQFNGIGGHIERGEDVLTAARRELLEEAGLQVPNLWLCGTVMIDTGETSGIGIFVFQGEFEGGILRPSAEGELVWLMKSELRQHPLVEDLPVLLAKVLEMDRFQPPFAASYQFDERERLVIKFG